jgi:inorganic pyrophosphatase
VANPNLLALDVVIEIPKGSRNKYEFDHSLGCIRLDRVLFSSVHFPADYGFIPNTRSADGDPLDVIVIVNEPTFPGCHVKVRPIGLLLMRDEMGGDEKILAVPLADPRFDGVTDLEHLPKHLLVEIENFFQTYKMLEGKETFVKGWQGLDQATSVLERSLEAFNNASA